MTQLVRGIKNIKLPQQGCVVTIGNFDGIHLGHQTLIEEIKNKAKALQTRSMVIIFEPQPAEYFSKGKATTPRLTRFREKFHLLSQQGIDYVLVLPFNKNLVNLSAQEFVKNILVDALKIKYVLVGKDFRFGKARQGDIKFLAEAAKKYNFEAATLDDIKNAESRISSTAVRNALARGDHDEVQTLLGRQYSMEGRVRHGNKLGRTIGFPTANIFLHRAATPVHGIYVVAVKGLKGKTLKGVANVGERPTVGGTRTLLEVHIFDFDEEIYGKNVVVEFYHKLRDEERYDTIELMKEQIIKDAANARTWWMGSCMMGSDPAS